jgi:transcriptional regulator with XRE-family HTH domain
VGLRVRSWRLKRGFSQSQLASAVGMTQASLSNYETGKRELPLISALRLTDALDITLADLVNIEEVILLRDSRIGRALPQS